MLNLTLKSNGTIVRIMLIKNCIFLLCTVPDVSLPWGIRLCYSTVHRSLTISAFLFISSWEKENKFKSLSLELHNHAGREALAPISKMRWICQFITVQKVQYEQCNPSLRGGPPRAPKSRHTRLPGRTLPKPGWTHRGGGGPGWTSLGSGTQSYPWWRPQTNSASTINNHKVL